MTVKKIDDLDTLIERHIPELQRSLRDNTSSNPWHVSLSSFGVFLDLESSMESKETYNELFELLETERGDLRAAIAKAPTTWAELHELNQRIADITRRAAPLYQKGQGMARDDLNLIDDATLVLSGVEDKLKEATQDVESLRGNLHFLYTGAGMLH